ncbi:cold acclimation protein WCOR413 [Medicago truncatula]|uniref:Cold acclimation protein WCOR413 n=1 Tax=Medicago truncatula TaxID=3880 RepID=G7JDL8_MEDTR|nr:cold acclimation protein WCOR413 [Medicago truncatula]
MAERAKRYRWIVSLFHCLGTEKGRGVTFPRFVLDRTNWKVNILTSLLIPYIIFSLLSIVFYVIKGEIGK